MQVLGAALGSGVSVLLVYYAFFAFTPAFCAWQCAEEFTSVTLLFVSGSAPTALFSTRVYMLNQVPPPPPIAHPRSARNAVCIIWAALAFEAWDLLHGTFDATAHILLRLGFYGADFLIAATSFTLYTTLARFWADLAFAARQRSGASRPMGGGDEYR